MVAPKPAVPAVTAARLTGGARRGELPLLVLGPSLGTSATALWSTCAAGLTDAFDVVAWDLPGHGHNRAVPTEPFSLAELAAGVLAVVDDVLEQRGEVGGSFAYAGVSVGGAVGLHLLLDAPWRVSSAVLLCTGAHLGGPEAWAERIAQVRAGGTASLVPASSGRWFAPGFLEAHPGEGAALLRALEQTSDDGYVAVCEAIAGFDVRDRLAEVAAPVLAVAGEADAVTPPTALEAVATGVPDGRLVVLPGVAHLAPFAAPQAVAALLRRHVLGEEPPEAPAPGAHPGLDPRSRSLVAVAVLAALGRHDELAPHVRAARGHGVTAEEVEEALLQAAAHGGGADTGAAVRVARQVLAEDGRG